MINAIRKVFLRLLVALLFLASKQNVLAFQERPPVDSIKFLSLADVYELVLANHPLVKQASLVQEEAEQKVLEAKGGFDPKLTSRLDKKYFKSKDYFSIWQSELKVPVLINTDLKFGYEENDGIYLNPERTVPENGLLYAGISVPIGQGMLTDSRRAALKEAKIYTEIAEAEQTKLLNKALFQVAKDYWEWYQAHQKLVLIKEGIDLAAFRYNAIIERVINGDAAPIDSLEAGITLQSRKIDLKQGKLELQKAVFQLSVHLWNEEGQPLLINEDVVPVITFDLNEEFFGNYSLNDLLELAGTQHPEIVKLKSKRQQLDVERRLYQELLKPVINLNYNFLYQPTGFMESFENTTFAEDYKLGVDFSFPLFLRKERAKLKQNKIKQLGLTYELAVTRADVLNTLKAAYLELEALEEIIESQKLMVRQYEALLAGEREKFLVGESSLFLVNSRENKLLEAKLKLIDFQAKYKKAEAAVLWAAGAYNSLIQL